MSTNNNKPRAILAPSKLIINDEDNVDKDETKHQTLSRQNSQLQSFTSSLSRYESCEDTFFSKNTLIPSIEASLVSKDYNYAIMEKYDDDDDDKNKTTSFRELIKITGGNKIDKNKNYDLKKLKKRLKSLVTPIDCCNKKSRKINNNNWSRTCWTLFIAMILPLLVLYLALISNATNVLNKFCDPRFDVNNVQNDLSKHIHGQTEAIKKINKFFNEINDRAGFEILAIVGGIGVGKSYTVEIVKNSLKDTSESHDYFPPLYTKENQAYSSLSICKCNLIRLENLRNDDVTDATRFVSYLKTKSKKHHCILVLAVFNPEEIDQNLKRTLNLVKSSAFIESEFRRANLNATIVNYVSLTDDALLKCIDDVSVSDGIRLTIKDVENIKNDLKEQKIGCKTAYARVMVAGNAARKSSDDDKSN